MTLMWLLYEFLYVIGLLLYVPGAVWRRRLPHRGWGMRLGRYPAEVRRRINQHPSIWVHAVSVGEVLAAGPLLDALQAASPETPLVLSTITAGGFGVATQRFAGRVIPIYFPLDLRWCVGQALSALRPKALILMEAELWPVAIHAARARGVPVLVVNGRISPRAFARYRRIKGWVAPMLRSVDQWLMQSREDADRIVQLGAPTERVQVAGSLKWDASRGVRPSAEAVRQLAARLGLSAAEPVIVAGSTHRGEEPALLKAFASVRTSHPSARLIIAPRHLERLSAVEGLTRQAGFSAVRLSQAASGAPWDVGLVDAFGQLPQYYGVATIVFIGGSLVAHGGQNPLEAASLGKPVVFGPSMHNFSVIAHQLLAHHAARQVARAEELGNVFQELLADQRSAAAMGRQAQELTERFQGATQRTVEALLPWLRGERAWPRGYG